MSYYQQRNIYWTHALNSTWVIRCHNFLKGNENIFPLQFRIYKFYVKSKHWWSKDSVQVLMQESNCSFLMALYSSRFYFASECLFLTLAHTAKNWSLQQHFLAHLLLGHSIVVSHMLATESREWPLVYSFKITLANFHLYSLLTKTYLLGT